jgi:hypothetical protein
MHTPGTTTHTHLVFGPVHLAYEPPASGSFLSEQISTNQPRTRQINEQGLDGTHYFFRKIEENTIGMQKWHITR